MSDDTKKPPRKKAAPAEAKPPGRPSIFTQEVADEICERLSDGQPLRQICRDEHMPSWQTVYRWAEDNAELSRRIARARELGHDAIAEDTMALIDEEPERYMTEQGSRIDPAHLQWRKNQVEQRMKLLSKWSPKYRDKQTTELTGPNGGPVEFTGITRRIVKANE